MNRLFRHAGCVLAFAAAGVAAQDQGKAAAPAEQYQALLREFQTAGPTYFQSTNDAERQAIVARMDKATVRLLELVQKNPKEPFALEALTQVVTLEYWLNTYTSHPGWGKESPQAKAIAQMLRDYLESDRLVETCKRVNFGFRPECETFLRTVLEKNPHREVQAAACLRLAQLLAGRVEKLEVLKGQPELAKRYEDVFGKEYMDGFYTSGYTVLEMEAGPFLGAVYELVNPRRVPSDEIVHLSAHTSFDVGIVHYASDTPYSRRQSLLSKSLSFFGVDATYACAIAIVRRIIQLEIARLG